jgi:hypothetical protein
LKFLIIKTSDHAQSWTRWSHGDWSCLCHMTRIRRNTAYQRNSGSITGIWETTHGTSVDRTVFVSKRKWRMDGKRLEQHPPIIGSIAMWCVNVVQPLTMNYLYSANF